MVMQYARLSILFRLDSPSLAQNLLVPRLRRVAFIRICPFPCSHTFYSLLSQTPFPVYIFPVHFFEAMLPFNYLFLLLLLLVRQEVWRGFEWDKIPTPLTFFSFQNCALAKSVLSLQHRPLLQRNFQVCFTMVTLSLSGPKSCRIFLGAEDPKNLVSPWRKSPRDYVIAPSSFSLPVQPILNLQKSIHVSSCCISL